MSVFTTGSFLYPVAKIVEVTTGIPLTTAIFALGAFSMVYVALGGLRGVVVTDVLQFVILFAAVVIAVPLAFDKIGGVGTFFEKVPEGFFELFEGEYTPGFVIAFAIYNMFFLSKNGKGFTENRLAFRGALHNQSDSVDVDTHDLPSL